MTHPFCDSQAMARAWAKSGTLNRDLCWVRCSKRIRMSRTSSHDLSWCVVVPRFLFFDAVSIVVFYSFLLEAFYFSRSTSIGATIFYFLFQSLTRTTSHCVWSLLVHSEKGMGSRRCHASFAKRCSHNDERIIVCSCCWCEVK